MTDDPASPVSIVEYTDPGCIWSWSSDPKLRWLRFQLGDDADWRRVFGIAHGDLSIDDPGFDPVESAPAIFKRWSGVVDDTGAPLRSDPVRVFKSTRPLALVAKASEAQGREIADRVLRRLRESVFVASRPPQTTKETEETLAGVPGLDLGQLLVAVDSGAVQESVEGDWVETRNPKPEVFGLEGPLPWPGAAKQDGDHVRYSFPTLIISGPHGIRFIPGWRPMETYLEALEAVAPGSAQRFEQISPDVAIDHFGTLTNAELELFTGAARPPSGAEALQTANGPLWFDRNSGLPESWLES